MNREIKFRAWDKHDERMIEFDVVYGLFPNLRISEESNRKAVKETYELMQFTGLFDRNGKEIYQNDIVKIDRDKANYGETSYGGFAEVMPKTCGFEFRCFSPSLEEIDSHPKLDEDGDPITWDSSSLWHISNSQNIEVIGNRFETPNLLHQEKEKL